MNFSTSDGLMGVTATLKSSNFQLCQSYNVTISPTKFPENSSTWNSGFSETFTYFVISSSPRLDLKPGIDNVDIKFPDKLLFCDDLEVSARQIKLSNDSLRVEDSFSSKTIVKMGEKSTSLSGLNSCSFYLLEVRSSGKNSTWFSTGFRTRNDEGKISPFNKGIYQLT